MGMVCEQLSGRYICMNTIWEFDRKRHSGMPLGWKLNVSIPSLCKVHTLDHWIPLLLEPWRVSLNKISETQKAIE